jgi:hypothetical protein
VQACGRSVHGGAVAGNMNRHGIVLCWNVTFACAVDDSLPLPCYLLDIFQTVRGRRQWADGGL